MSKIFISYKAESFPDTELAKQIHAHLKQAGLDPFVSEVDIRLGESWDQRIEEELHNCDYFILLLSENSIKSDMVTEEVRRAREIGKQSDQKKPLILPIRVKLPKNVQISYDLAGYLNKIQVRFWEKESDTPVILDEIVSIATGKKHSAKANNSSNAAFRQLADEAAGSADTNPMFQTFFKEHPVDLKLKDEKQQLRQHLGSFLAPPELDQVTDMLYYYISSSPHVLNMFEQLSTTYNSNAGRRVAAEMKTYLDNPNDLFPESQYGVYGKMDDAWLIHNVAYTFVQAGIAQPQYFGVDWNMLVAANQIVVSYLPRQITMQLNNMMMNLLSIIGQEAGYNFQAMFTQNAQNQYVPNIGTGQAAGTDPNNLYQQLANGIVNLFS